MPTFFKSDMPSRFEQKREKQIAKEANWRAVCRQVDKRDGYRCRCCGASGMPDGIDPLDKLHRHHMTFRSKGGQDVASNLLLLCPRCHDAVHVKRTLRIEPTTSYIADGPLNFWRTVDGEEHMVRREIRAGQPERD